jgi:hypothetical protein
MDKGTTSGQHWDKSKIVQTAVTDLSRDEVMQGNGQHKEQNA